MRKNLAILIVALGVLAPSGVKANNVGEGLGVGISVPDSAFIDGDIACSKGQTLVKCDTEYNQDIAGVIVDNPAIYIDNNEQGNRPLVTSGKAEVLVNSSNGPIQPGDYITSSKTPGVGIKATKTGVIVGIAIDSFNVTDKTTVGKIKILVGVKTVIMEKQVKQSVYEELKDGFLLPNLTILGNLRYWLAILLALVTFSISFIYFGRISKSGVEALGRNPLASRAIQINLILSMLLTAIIMIGGLALAYAIVII